MVFPLQWLQWLSPFTRDILEAEGDCVHQIPGLPPSIMRICYEIIFPFQYPRPCADWILNVTNDAWFGYSPGPFQHLASTKFRAIEEGLPAVRVANTGVSAMFDGLGRVCGYLPLETRGFLDVQLPKPVSTSYRYLHAWIYFSLLVVGLLGSMWHSYRKKIRPWKNSAYQAKMGSLPIYSNPPMKQLLTVRLKSILQTQSSKKGAIGAIECQKNSFN